MIDCDLTNYRNDLIYSAVVVVAVTVRSLKHSSSRRWLHDYPLQQLLSHGTTWSRILK